MGSHAVGDAYSAHVVPVAQALGTTVHPTDQDRAVIEPWAAGIGGKILDLGTGTGRWAGFLTSLGHDVEGVDPSSGFIDLARQAHPTVPFRVGTVDDLVGSAERWSGILAWYSLIHLDPDAMLQTLTVLRSVVVDDGSILLSFFSGPKLEMIQHPVAPAYRWPMATLIDAVNNAGFVVTGQYSNPQSPHSFVTAKAN